MGNVEVSTFISKQKKALDKTKIYNDRKFETQKELNEHSKQIWTIGEHILQMYMMTEEISKRPKISSWPVEIEVAGENRSLFLIGYMDNTGHGPKQFSSIQCRLQTGSDEQVMFNVHPHQVSDYFDKPLNLKALIGAHKTILWMQATLAEQQDAQQIQNQ